MIYQFSCPHPCTRVIQVDAHDDEDAIWKIIKAGAMICRKEGRTACDSAIPFIYPLSYEQLREIVRLIMQRLTNTDMGLEACPSMG